MIGPQLMHNGHAVEGRNVLLLVSEIWGMCVIAAISACANCYNNILENSLFLDKHFIITCIYLIHLICKIGIILHEDYMNKTCK